RRKPSGRKNKPDRSGRRNETSSANQVQALFSSIHITTIQAFSLLVSGVFLGTDREITGQQPALSGAEFPEHLRTSHQAHFCLFYTCLPVFWSKSGFLLNFFL